MGHGAEWIVPKVYLPLYVAQFELFYNISANVAFLEVHPALAI